jgi:hypothetical protein
MKPPSKKERLAADKQAAAAANRRIVEKKIELGRKLAALREATPNNKRFGRTVRDKFNLHDSQEVAEMMRVARRYGNRPGIFRNVGWRVLTELSSSVTSDEERRQFEARIPGRRARQWHRDSPRSHHDWSSHGADRFGLMWCIDYDQPDGAQPPPERCRGLRTTSSGGSWQSGLKSHMP